jgi:hypothetical protein
MKSSLLLGSLLALAPRLTHRPRVNLAAGFVCAMLVILPWLRALARGRLKTGRRDGAVREGRQSCSEYGGWTEFQMEVSA